MPNLNKPFIPNGNPYDGLDRGLFIARDLLFPDSVGGTKQEDTYCRISRVEVYNFQGASNYSIVGYKVSYWAAKPESDEDYAKAQTYTEPRGNKDTFYFQCAPQAFTPELAENLCITDFIQNVRRLKPSAWPSFQGLYDPYSLAKDTLLFTKGTGVGVDNVAHRALFTSVAGAPLGPVTNQLRYRGYDLSAEDTRLPAWIYASDQFLNADVPFLDRTQMVEQAKAVFATDGRVKAMELLGVS
jgi:hypothetical protein